MQNKRVVFCNFVHGHLNAIKTTHFIEKYFVLKFQSFKHEQLNCLRDKTECYM